MRYLLILALFLASCALAKKRSSNVIVGNWQLSVFTGPEKSYAEIFGQRRPTLNFTADGKVTGNTGCNHLSGSYTVSANVFRLNEPLITTKMACPGYEETIFLNALARINNFKIQNEALHLLTDSTVIMVFNRVSASK